MEPTISVRLSIDPSPRPSPYVPVAKVMERNLPPGFRTRFVSSRISAVETRLFAYRHSQFTASKVSSFAWQLRHISNFKGSLKFLSCHPMPRLVDSYFATVDAICISLRQSINIKFAPGPQPISSSLQACLSASPKWRITKRTILQVREIFPILSFSKRVSHPLFHMFPSPHAYPMNDTSRLVWLF